ncbi:MAG: Potassium channel, partial [Watsoniomyces obsoletus]
MTRKLAFEIRKTADDLCHRPGRRYSYEEWVEFTRLIRFTKMELEELEHDEDQEGVVEWDWLDENSPMLSEQSESEWILDRLCESLMRLLRKNNLGGSPEPDVTWRGLTFNDEDVDPKDTTSSAKVNEAKARQERRHRATGADA